MDEIKRISNEHILEIVSKKGFDHDLMLKDYYLTVVLYLIKGVDGIYFKGGTALQKIFLDYSRISEDIDFTLTREIGEVKKDITSALVESGLFGNITQDKNVEGFTRIVVNYKGFSGEDSAIFIDLNKRAKLTKPSEKHEISHFYKGFIPEFSFSTISQEEMIAEKVADTIGRNKPRDHYDVYQIIKNGLPINIEMVKKKCRDSGYEFDITRMFNQAQKLHRRWHEDMAPLLAEEISFEEIMKTLAKQFKLKEEKEKLKDKK